MSSYDPRIERVIRWQRKKWSSLSDAKKKLLWSFIYSAYKFKNTFRLFSRREKPIEQNFRYRDFKIKKAVKPTESDWGSIKKTTSKKEPVVDIIVPVYSGYQETLRCIYSVLKVKNLASFELIVVNDSAQPSSQLTAELRKLSEEFGFTLIENQENQGFVKSTNIGMRHHPNRDVIWLNSDTEVFDNWIDLILDLADNQPTAATITPLSNNATIFSYPDSNVDFPFRYKISDESLSSICSTIHKEYINKPVEVPTGVGFCMYVRRKALNECGLLDEHNFGKGYGEENDLCQRFIKAGWKNLAIPSVFVRHFGRVSFKEKTIELQRKARAKLSKIHPTYERQLQDFVLEDPLREWRIRIDAEIFHHEVSNAHLGCDGKRSLLLITHNLGGGTATYTDDFANSAKSRGMAVYEMNPDTEDSARIVCEKKEYPNLQEIDVKYSEKELLQLISGLKVTDIYLNHYIGYPKEFPLLLKNILVKAKEVNLEITIHDMYYICPFITMVKPGFSSVCKNFDSCDTCTKLYKAIPVWEMRNNFALLAAEAKIVTTPSDSTSNIYKSVFPKIIFRTIPHPDEPSSEKSSLTNLGSQRNQVIGVIGAISFPKGLEVIRKLAEYIKLGDKLRLVVIGMTANDRSLRKLGVIVTGRYSSENEARQYIKELGVTSIFIPSIWPETYCYTLSIALRTGLPVQAFDIGAPAERLRALGLEGSIIPLKYSEDIPKLASVLKKPNLKSYNFVGNPSNINEILSF